MFNSNLIHFLKWSHVFIMLKIKMQKYKYFFKVAYFLTSFLYNNLWGKYYVRFDVKSLAV